MTTLTHVWELIRFRVRAIAQAVSRWLPAVAVWDSSPGLLMWDFVVDKVALGQVFSEYFGFPCQSSFHQLLQKLSSPIIWGLYNRLKRPQYQGLRYLET
jgi:hypothetical protein